jgi:hypothetical protein
MSKMRALILVLALGLSVACAAKPASDLPARLAAANVLAGGLAESLVIATRAGAIRPGSETASAILVTLSAVDLSLDGAGNAWRAGLPNLADSNLAAAERQMAGLQPLLPVVAEEP